MGNSAVVIRRDVGTKGWRPNIVWESKCPFFVRCSKSIVVYIMLDGGVGSWFEDIKRLLLWINAAIPGRLRNGCSHDKGVEMRSALVQQRV